MARLPIPGKDAGTWGNVLNDYLSQAHKTDGTLKDDSVGAAQLQDDSVTASALARNSVTNDALADNVVDEAAIADGSITETLLDAGVQTKLNATGDWNSLSNKPAVGAWGATPAEARMAIGAAGFDGGNPTAPVGVQPRRGTAAEWSAANPVLAAGELGYETDTKKSKRGDGATAWNSLPYDSASVAPLVDGPVLDNKGPSLVYSDSSHNGFPHMIRRSDGLLIAVWRRGSTHSGGNGAIRRAFSDDNGTTWRNAAGATSTSVLDSSSDLIQIDTLIDGLDSRDPCLAELSDGRVVLSYYKRQYTPTAWNRSTCACIRISSDGGITFGSEIKLPDTFTNFVGHSSPVVELPGGVVWQPIFGSSTATSPGVGTVITYMQATLSTLHLAGNWTQASTPIYGGAEWASESHIILNRAGDGLIAAVRFDTANQTRIFQKPLSSGSWTQVGSFSALSTPRMLRTASGRILVPHRRGTGAGVNRSALAWSDDDGITWLGAATSTLYLDDFTDYSYAYAGIAEIRPGACRVFYGSQRSSDDQSEVYTRPLAVHPVHAPARLEVPVAPWASTAAGNTKPVDDHPAVYYNATKDGRADGDTLVRWHDLSGNLRHALPGGSGTAPVYDVDEEGRLCLLFDGINDYVDIPMLLGNSLWHAVFIVAERLETPSPGGNVHVLLTTKGGSSNNGWMLQWRGTDAIIRQGIGTGTPNTSSTPVSLGAPSVVGCSLDPAIAQVWLNGQIHTTTSGISYTAPPGFVTRVGNTLGGTESPFQGRIYAIQAFERSMTTAEIAQQATWLAEQCGVTYA